MVEAPVVRVTSVPVLIVNVPVVPLIELTTSGPNVELPVTVNDELFEITPATVTPAESKFTVLGFVMLNTPSKSVMVCAVPKTVESKEIITPDSASAKSAASAGSAARQVI